MSCTFFLALGATMPLIRSGFSPIVVEVRVPRSSCSFDGKGKSHTGEHIIFGGINRYLILGMQLANCHQQF